MEIWPQMPVGVLNRSLGRALEWHSRGQRFDPAYLHQQQTVRPTPYGLVVYRKPLAGRVVQKRLLPMRKNKTPSAIVGMRSGNYKLQNKGRPFKNEVAKTV